MTRPGDSVPAKVLQQVKSCIADYAGLELPDWVLASRLEQRLRALDISDPGSYARLIGSDAGLKERELLLEALRVGETRFFRHRSHVTALTDVVVPAILQRSGQRGSGGRVNAWSAGCASGEEAYTLAMVLRRMLPASYTVRVSATDISSDALEVARRGVYPEAALAHVPDDWREWGFAPCAPDRLDRPRVEVQPRIRRLVEFDRRNLADGGYRTGFDVIWCRNVLIYFSRQARDRVIEALIDSLVPGGFLFVGYAESLRDFDRVQAVRAPDAVLYRKAEPAAARPAPPTPAPPSTADPAPVFRRRAEPVQTGRRNEQVTAEEAVIELRGRYDDEARLSAELAAVMSGPYASAVIDLDGAEFLGDQAAAVLRRARSAARAAGMRVDFVATRPGHQRFLTRAGLLEEDDQ